jgi:hypothetical protein
MTIAEFKILCGQHWGSAFDVKLGKLAKKLHRQIYKKDPAVIRCKIARNRVPAYPCGIIEQAYRELRAPDA